MAKYVANNFRLYSNLKFTICVLLQRVTSSLWVFWYCASILDTNQMKYCSAVAHVQAHNIASFFVDINFITRSQWAAVDSFIKFYSIYSIQIQFHVSSWSHTTMKCVEFVKEGDVSRNTFNFATLKAKGSNSSALKYI